jgi:hypothetical protein
VTTPGEALPAAPVGPQCLGCGRDALRTVRADVGGTVVDLVAEHLEPGTDPDADPCTGSGVPPVSGDRAVDELRRQACARARDFRIRTQDEWHGLAASATRSGPRPVARALRLFSKEAVAAEEQARLWQLAAVHGCYGPVLVHAVKVLIDPVPVAAAADTPFEAAVLDAQRQGAAAWISTVRGALSVEDTAALLRVL